MKKGLISMLVLLFVGLQSVFAQSREISGVVTSAEDGLSIPGVSVIVKGTTNGVSTDLDGKYSLKVPADAKVLVFSFVGMETQEVTIAGKTTINVVLKPAAEQVGEVMVVAYGSAKKSSFTGSASTVKSEDLQKMNVSNVSKALEGLSTGVQVTSGSGQPGASATIRIRGIGSINASADPLIVVDGFPYNGKLNSINNNDIESFTVLKDASATALYGSRAANGVIIITTKKGKKGQSEIELKSTMGFSSRAIPEYETVSRGEYYRLTWENIYNKNGGDGQYASDNLIDKLGGYNIYADVADNEVVTPDGKLTKSKKYKWNDDWQDEMFKVGVRQDHTLSARFGTEKTKYYISANFLDADGIIKDSEFKRYGARVNVDSDVKDWIKVTVGLAASTSQQNFPKTSGSSYVNSFMYSRMIAPIYPVYLYDKKGVLQTESDGSPLYDYGNEFGRSRKYSANSNALGVLGLDKRKYINDVVSARGSVDFKIIEGLNLKLSASADYRGYTGLTHQNARFGDAEAFKGRSTRTSSRTVNFVANQLVTYKKDFDAHHFDILVGHESTNLIYNTLSATRTGFPGLGFVELDAAAVPEGSGSREDQLHMESYLSRVNYDYDDKYYLSLSMRTDGSSRFSKDERWGTFWSVGASWRMSQEDFMQNLDWVTNLKIKASYGAQGNDRLSTYYAYLGTFDPAYANIKNPGLLLSRLATPDLTWEKNVAWNFGVEAKLFDKIDLNAEYFIRESDDLLFGLPLAPSTGVSSISANIGAIKNTGFEVELGALIFDTNDFKWRAKLNLTHYKNEITELPQESIVDGSKRWEVGRSIYDFWIRKYAGVDPATGAPMWYVDEKDADGKVIGQTTTTKYSSGTRYYVGSSIPDVMGGFNNEFSYKGFNLSVLVSYAIGGKVYDSSYASLMGGGSDFGTNWHKDMLKRWTKDNPDTDVPIINGNVSKDANSMSDRFLTDASYLNLKNITLSYILPERITKSIGLTSIKVFAAGDNLLLLSKRKGMDPQQSLSGVLDNSYTPLRTISLGVNVKF